MTAELHANEPLAVGSPARQLLEELAQTYRFLLLVRADGNVAWVTPAWHQVLGGPDLVGRRLRDRLANLAQPEQTFPILTHLHQDGAAYRTAVELVTERRATLPFDVTVLPLEVSGSEPQVLVIARPARATQTDLAPDSLTECHPDALIAVDEEGFVTTANAAAGELFGLAPDQLVGSAAAVLASDPEEMRQLIGCLAARQATELDFDARRHGDAPLPVAARIAPHRAPNGEHRGTLLSLRSAASGSEASDALARRNDELEHCVNSLAHDLRSPLVALLGFSRLLRQDYGERLEDTGNHFLDRIEQAGRTMEALIHDLLELSRIGQPGERPALIDPRGVLLQLGAELKPRLEAAGVRLQLPAEPPLVYCDQTRLYQLFCNLISNAIEHMGECERREIDVTIVEDAGFHRIGVCDAGRGVEPENHERIFEAFQSLGSGRDGRRSTGIGLAIVRKIAETRGGRAWVESRRGEGAHFYVTLARP